MAYVPKVRKQLVPAAQKKQQQKRYINSIT